MKFPAALCFAASLAGLCAVRGEEGVVPVRLEDFIGGTGATAVAVLRQDLESSGFLKFSQETGQWLIRGSSSAGRIDGAVIDINGEVVLSSHYDAADLRDNAHAFADDVLELITGTRGISTTKIAYVSDRSGSKEIYLADRDGQRVQRVTSDGVLKGAPALGPGSILLAYTTYRGGFADIMLTDLRSGDRRVVLNAPGTNSGVCFSPDGARLALAMSVDGDPEIHLSTLTGGRVKRLTHSRSVEFSPSWSPDGRRLVFSSDATGAPQLYIISRAGGEPERLETGYRVCTGPDWAADGVKIAFTARQPGGPSVVVHDLTSGQSRLVLAGAEDPAWAPDGRHLACVKDGDLVVVDTVRGTRETIISGAGTISEPAWSR